MMQESRTDVSPQSGRMDALRKRHALLEGRIFEEQKRPFSSGDMLRKLKRQKLRLKEEIEAEGSCG